MVDHLCRNPCGQYADGSDDELRSLLAKRSEEGHWSRAHTAPLPDSRRSASHECPLVAVFEVFLKGPSCPPCQRAIPS